MRRYHSAFRFPNHLVLSQLPASSNFCITILIDDQQVTVGLLASEMYAASEPLGHIGGSWLSKLLL